MLGVPRETPSQTIAGTGRGSLSTVLQAVLAITLVLAGCGLLYVREAGQIAQRQTERETTRVNLLAKLLQVQLHPVTEDLQLLADGDGLRAYLDNGSSVALEAAKRRARFFSQHKPSYDQIRFIDSRGREVLRVNHGGVVVADVDLQDLSANSYFQQITKLAPDALYVSAFELNTENGRIEEPIKPVLRFAVPLIDAGGYRRGVYMINYLGGNLIRQLQDLVPLYAHRLRILNGQGYWLKAEDAQQEWGFALSGRSQFTLARSDPQLWSQMSKKSFGQVQSAARLITWRRLLPAQILDVPASALRAGDSAVIIASEVSPREWSALFTGLRQIMLTLALALTVLALASVLLFQRWRDAMRTLRASNDQLESRVRERTAELAHSYEMLQDREQLLAETGELAKVGGWDHDPVTGEGRWTAEVARIHAVDPTLGTSRQFGLDFYPPESRKRLEAALQKSASEGTPYDLELEFTDAQGKHKWVRTICRPVMQDGKVTRVRGALQDVTERKHTDLKLQAQLQRLNLLEQITRAIGERQDLPSILQITSGVLQNELPLDFVCVGLHEPQQNSLRIAAVSGASIALATELSMPNDTSVAIDENGLAHSMRGQLVYEPDIAQLPYPFPQRLASAGLSSLVIAPLQIESQVFGVLIAARRKSQAFSSGECEFLRQLSEHVALAAHQAQLHGALQSAYQELRTTQQGILQQERLRVLGQMASGIAHDINNAISPIMLYTESLLEKESSLSERTRESLRTIQRAVSDVAETVARMREFYRQREPQSELRAVQLNELISQVTELTRARWQSIPQQRGVVIEMRTELATALPSIKGIESEIREALTNLIFNAVDSMPQGGLLTLRTRPLDTQIALEVVDNGTGMDEDTQRRCLEPFFTTKGERGTGLGLAMVYGVMQRHEGSIQIESSPAAGTTVRLKFNVADTKQAAPEVPREVRPTKLKLLLIDDDPIVLKSLREILQLDGHQVLTASGGQQGIDTFRASYQNGLTDIAAVVTDLGMPHVDGRSVAAAIKQISGTTPVIMLTGWGARLIAEGNAPNHVDRVLSKPPRLSELRAALGDLAPSC